MLTGRLFGGTFAISCPSIRICPSVGSSKPAIIRSNVVLPQPDGPSKTKNSPDKMSRLTLSTAVTLPKRLETLRIWMIGDLVWVSVIITIQSNPFVSSGDETPLVRARLTGLSSPLEANGRRESVHQGKAAYHQCAAAMPLAPCTFRATAVRTTVNMISNVEAALTSGVTEKRTIE